MSSVLQPWVEQLGLRHQGVLLTAVRGCDTAPKNDPSKALVRSYRAVVLVPFCGDPAKAQTFIELVSRRELQERMVRFRRECDQYPHHYVMHLMHAAQIVGYKHPSEEVWSDWSDFYSMLCRGLHVSPELESDMDSRLNADEQAFAWADQQ